MIPIGNLHRNKIKLINHKNKSYENKNKINDNRSLSDEQSCVNVLQKR